MKLLAPIVRLTRPGWNPHTTTLWFLTRSLSTHYDTLGVKNNATNKDIKNAFVNLSKKYHPDVSSHKDSAQKFSEIADAYAVLGNKDSKVIYDRLHNTVSSSGQAGVNSSIDNLRQRKYPEVHYPDVKFSSNKDNTRGNNTRYTGHIVVTAALTLSLVSFVQLLRKSFRKSAKLRKEEALEMQRIVTGKSFSASPIKKQSKGENVSERLQQLKL